MKFASRSLLALAAIVAILALCGSASAANVTVGPSLTGTDWVESGRMRRIRFVHLRQHRIGRVGRAALTSPVDRRDRQIQRDRWLDRRHLPSAHRQPGGRRQAVSSSRASVPPGDRRAERGDPELLHFAADHGGTDDRPDRERRGLLRIRGSRAVLRMGRRTARKADTSPVGASFQKSSASTSKSSRRRRYGARSDLWPTAGGSAVTIAGTDLEGATSVTLRRHSLPPSPPTPKRRSPPSAPASRPDHRLGSGPRHLRFADLGTTVGPGYTYVRLRSLPDPTLRSEACVVPNLIGKKLTAAKSAPRQGPMQARRREEARRRDRQERQGHASRAPRPGRSWQSAPRSR